LEWYSAAHSETIEQLMDWPYRRFIKAFEGWQRRLAGEAVDRRHEMHIAAIHANTNWDMEDNDRADHLEKLEEYYIALKNALTRDPAEVAAEEQKVRDMEMNDPFLRAGRNQISRISQITEGAAFPEGW
jgi:hypothetical protein